MNIEHIKTMKKIVVLGAGMVGRAIALDLSAEHEVHSADIDQKALDRLHETGHVTVHREDLSYRTKLQQLVKPFDLVISAVPGFMGFKTIETVIRCGKDLVDISFLPEDVLPLDGLAKENGVTAITDCGVAPGIPNIIAGYYNHRHKVTRFEYMVGGLPSERTLPFEYKAPFSPCDVIEEYTRPARFVENGQLVTKPALSDAELINFPGVGTLEAFNSDGLRSLLFTLPGIPFMKEKTLRYPGHIHKIMLLRDAGFFSREPVSINGNFLTPFEVTSEILKKSWFLNHNEKEFTIMRINISFQEEEQQREVVYNLFDTTDEMNGISSMARTTGYTCTAAANMMISGLFDRKGVFPPELIGIDQQNFDFIFGYLAARNVNLDKDC